jgi:glucose-1-phosphate thymidylyltransferase
MSFAINKKCIRGDLLVIGGDNLFDGDLDGFLSFAKTRQPNPVIGVYNIEDIRQATKYGVAKLDRKNKLIDFQEKPKSPKSTLVAMCLYYFPKDKLRLIKEYLNTKIDKHDATGFYIDWLRKRVPVFGFVFGRHWYDIGDHKFYNEAKERFFQDRRVYGRA